MISFNNHTLAIKIVKNFKKQYPHKAVTDLLNLTLLEAFSWIYSIEGHVYWINVYHNYAKLITCKGFAQFLNVYYFKYKVKEPFINLSDFI